MKTVIPLSLVALLSGSLDARARQAPESSGAATPDPSHRVEAAEGATATLDGAAASLRDDLSASIAELAELRERIAAERIPLGRELNELQSQQAEARSEYQQATRLLDSRTLDLSNLRAEIERREGELSYVENLIGDYRRNFESRLHIAELQRYEEALRPAADGDPSRAKGWSAQAALLDLSLDRLEEALGGTRFEGSAVDENGFVLQGRFLLVGPTATFRSEDGRVVGSVEQRLGSLQPAVLAFARPEHELAAAETIDAGVGHLPLDSTLGSARKIEDTEESFMEHVKKGGEVMVPIVILALAALGVALFKWVELSLQRKPAEKSIQALLRAVSEGDTEASGQHAQAIRGPLGRMLYAGVEHLDEPREVIEEVMYETLLTTRLRLQRFLPFLAICAASAPLLGLLGTVTGIIDTFKMITVFGSGDVKSLSGGISEALITTKFGLIVAIPSLLLHAFLSRKSRGIVDRMETVAVSFANAAAGLRAHSLHPLSAVAAGAAAIDPDHVDAILGERPSASPPEAPDGAVRASERPAASAR